MLNEGLKEPTSSASAALAPKVGRDVSSLFLRSGGTNLYNASMIAGATAGFFIAYNSNTTPGAGASLTAARILAAVPVAANGYANIDGVPDRYDLGIVLLFSTTLATFTAPVNPALHMLALEP